MSGIHFSGQFVSYKSLAQLSLPTQEKHIRDALKFGKAYLSNQSKFHVKTSGSTGTPKTILLTRDQLKISARMTIEALNLTPDYRALVCISTDGIGGKMMIVRGIELNMDLYLLEPRTKISIDKLPPIDFVALVPLQLQTLFKSESGRNFLSKCQVIIVGGGPLDAKTSLDLDKFKNSIYQTFGMTETVSHIALRRLNGPEKQLNYQALDGIYISKDERDCLTINGKVTNNVPVITNDMIELIDTGEFRWLGRLDEAINTGGYKVIPEKLHPIISACLSSAGFEVNFVTLGLPDPKWGQSVTLVLEREQLPQKTQEHIKHMLKGKLKAYEVPKSIKTVAHLPKTKTGKTDIPRLRELLCPGL